MDHGPAETSGDSRALYEVASLELLRCSDDADEYVHAAISVQAVVLYGPLSTCHSVYTICSLS